MKKFLFVIAILSICFLTACGKKNRKEYEGIDHIKQVTVIPTSTPTSTPTTSTPTPTTFEISNDDIMASYHRDENVAEVEFNIVCCTVYDKPFNGKALGYLVNETFTTENLYWADHNNMVGFDAELVRFFKTDERDIIYPVEIEDEDGVVWVYDNDTTFSLVPHPENYDFSDWGE